MKPYKFNFKIHVYQKLSKSYFFLEYQIYIYKTILEQIRYDNKKLTLQK